MRPVVRPRIVTLANTPRGVRGSRPAAPGGARMPSLPGGLPRDAMGQIASIGLCSGSAEGPVCEPTADQTAKVEGGEGARSSR